MKSSNAPFNEFGQSMILRDIEDLYISVDSLNAAVAGLTASLTNLTITVASLSSAIAGLGTMSAQNANAVAITGGTLSGTTISTSTFSGTIGALTSPLTVAQGGTSKTTIASDTFWYASSTDTLAETAITSFARTLVASVDAAAARTTLGITAGSLATLTDVTLTSLANLDLLRYDSGTSKWINYNLGRMTWTAATSEFALDGGTGASATSVVGIGKQGSRLLLAGTGNPLDFLLSGSVAAGTDISARVRQASSSQVSFYDQGTTVYSTGTEVLRWNCSSSASSRSFRYFVPVQLRDNSGGGSVDLIVSSAATELWDISDNYLGTNKYLTFVGVNGDSASTRRVMLQVPLDLQGKTVYADRATNVGVSLAWTATTFTLVSGAATITSTGVTWDCGSGDFTHTRSGGTPVMVIGSTTKVGSAAGSLGFYQGAGVAKQTVLGAKGGNAALTALMTALSNLGLVIDATT